MSRCDLLLLIPAGAYPQHGHNVLVGHTPFVIRDTCANLNAAAGEERIKSRTVWDDCQVW